MQKCTKRRTAAFRRPFIRHIERFFFLNKALDSCVRHREKYVFYLENFSKKYLDKNLNDKSTRAHNF